MRPCGNEDDPVNPFEHPDFTEARYRAIVRTARQTWQFIRYGEASNEVRSTLWRHDVDFSMHRHCFCALRDYFGVILGISEAGANVGADTSKMNLHR